VHKALNIEVRKQGVVTLFIRQKGYPHQEPCDGKLSSTVLNGSWGRRLPFRPLPLEGEGCDQKLKPNCHGGDMPTDHGVDI
ncbi:MAG: hypothetical protein P5674_26215, partial [Limnospira sp. PMC 289.06]|nr:hypothetical protein [Limnospira sp. PMC 289.06]